MASDEVAVREDDASNEEDRRPAAVSAFNPALKKIWTRLILHLGIIVLILCAFIFGVLSLFWAVEFHVEKNMSSLKVWVVDLDGQVDPFRQSETIVGPAVTDVADRIVQGASETLGYTVVSPEMFDYSALKVRQQIYDQHAYAAIVVNPNATTALRRAVTDGDTSYDPTQAVQVIVISAQDETTYSNYIVPALNDFQDSFSSYFGPRWIQRLVSESANISQVVPQAVNPAVGFHTVDLRPFSPAVATPAITIGLIYLIIVAFFNFPFLMPIHMRLVSGPHPPLREWQWLLWRIVSHILSYFFLSLFYSFVSLAFQIPFTNSPAPDTQPAYNPNAYGRGSFVVFWMLNWVGMAALGFPCENMAMVLGMPWSSLFLIFWVISNVATAFYNLDLAPQFYKWGRAWPLHRIVEAERTILFGTHSRIGLDFGILFAWIGVSLAFYPFANYIMRWKTRKGVTFPS